MRITSTVILIFLGTLSALAPAQAGQGRAQEGVVICHCPPGNVESCRAIVVAEAAVPAHSDHGDSVGDCDGETVNPLDVFYLHEDALALSGVSTTAFNDPSSPVIVTLTGGEFLLDPNAISLSVNGNPVSSGSLALTPNTISASSVLQEGRNEIDFKAFDVFGRPLYLKRTVWAGSSGFQVQVVDEDGLPVLAPVEITASLADDRRVTATQTVDTGFAIFSSLPPRTILFEARDAGGRIGTAGALGFQGSIQLRLLDFDPPSPVQNNDFSLGTDGWEVGFAPVVIEPHVEGIPSALTSQESVATLSRIEADSLFEAAPAEGTESAAAGAEPTTSIVNNDLVLGTSGEGEQNISRAFPTQMGTTAVVIRYRFITSEVPGGYFGSQYNDYFRVSLRSQATGAAESETNSMNGLGLGAFDFNSGATDWRTVTLETDPQADTVQVDVAVANVGDGLLDSQVVIDFVEEIRDQIEPSLAWDEASGGLQLTYEVTGSDLAQDATIEVFWASGPQYSDRLGAAIFTATVPAGTPQGQHGPVPIGGGSLEDDPAGTSHIIAAASETAFGAVTDVAVQFGANADAGALSAGLRDAILDALRAAGEASVTVTSTARTPEDQARAMFQNLVNPGNTISENIANQLALYAAPGDAVIGVFEQEVDGLTRDEILARAATIQAAMVAEINNQGPSNVSRHCADPAQVSVADVGAGVFGANGDLFVGAVQPRVTRFIDERGSNGCFHLEL